MNWVTHVIVSIVCFNINVSIVHFKFTSIFNKYLSDTHLQSCQTSTMEFFMKVIISLQTKKVIISESLTNKYLLNVSSSQCFQIFCHNNCSRTERTEIEWNTDLKQVKNKQQIRHQVYGGHFTSVCRCVFLVYSLSNFGLTVWKLFRLWTFEHLFCIFGICACSNWQNVSMR